MNHCGIQQNTNFSSFGNGEPVVCPKPRRFNFLNTAMNEPVKPLCFQMWFGAPDPEPHDSKPVPELLDLMFPPLSGAPEHTQPPPTASSPPFFCGSPPSRVSNPLIQDARFRDEKVTPIPPPMIPNPSSGMTSVTSPSPAYLRTSYGNKPSVRIEGFNCLNRDNRSVPALA